MRGQRANQSAEIGEHVVAAGKLGQSVPESGRPRRRCRLVVDKRPVEQTAEM